jgi:predicted membrane-bound dolichyl-phosphate-mannose-protein mannosyltransferase
MFGNPLWVQLFFALALLLGTVLLGIRVFKKAAVGLVAALLLSADPLLGTLTGEALLDLGQAVFGLYYLYFSLDKKPNYYLTGLTLGLLSASKFWAGGLFFFSFIGIILLYKKQTSLLFLIKQLLVAGIVFNLVYFQAYWQANFWFNNIFFQLKTLKYWFNHSVTSLPLASLFLFVSGMYQSWWGKKELVFEKIWSPLWPIGLLATFKLVWFSLRQKVPLVSVWLVGLAPLFYLVYLGIQAPFSRYFILILPYCYLALAQLMVDNIKEL